MFEPDAEIPPIIFPDDARRFSRTVPPTRKRANPFRLGNKFLLGYAGSEICRYEDRTRRGTATFGTLLSLSRWGRADSSRMIVPKSQHPKPPFPRQQQPMPGYIDKMRPRPDHGEESYRGAGKLTERGPSSRAQIAA